MHPTAHDAVSNLVSLSQHMRNPKYQISLNQRVDRLQQSIVGIMHYEISAIINQIHCPTRIDLNLHISKSTSLSKLQIFTNSPKLSVQNIALAKFPRKTTHPMTVPITHKATTRSKTSTFGYNTIKIRLHLPLLRRIPSIEARIPIAQQRKTPLLRHINIKHPIHPTVNNYFRV